jgi:tetratricopeptide (TPR) repeat protein
MRPSHDEVIERILDELERYADGVHRLNDPAYLLDTEIPEPLAEVYRGFDGGDLFHEALVLAPSSSLAVEGDRYRVGEVGGDELWVDRRGAVWRRDADGGPVLPEASAFDRWLAGYLDAEALVYDTDGEFRDGAFTGGGEIEPQVAARRERAMIKRDRKAAGPRYRLGLLLAEAGDEAGARECFEEVVAMSPGHAFAWVELAKISQRLGELDSAIDEMVEAASV